MDKHQHPDIVTGAWVWDIVKGAWVWVTEVSCVYGECEEVHRTTGRALGSELHISDEEMKCLAGPNNSHIRCMRPVAPFKRICGRGLLSM